MSATVDIETETAINVVSVPIQSVTVRDFSKDVVKTDNETDIENDKEIEDQQITTTSENLLVQTEDIRKVVLK